MTDPGPMHIQASIARDMLIGFVATIAVLALLAGIAAVAMQGQSNLKEWEAEYVVV